MYSDKKNSYNYHKLFLTLTIKLKLLLLCTSLLLSTLK